VYCITFKVHFVLKSGIFIACLLLGATGLPVVGAVSVIGYAPIEKPNHVWKLNIEGNHTFPDILIKQQLATKAYSFWEKLTFWDRKGHAFDEIQLEKDAIRIRNFYNRRGFYNTQVTYHIEPGRKPWKKHIIFTVDEGAAIQIETIDFKLIATETD